MVDRDLAVLYGVETKRLKEAVRRNQERFPKHFMFEMTNEEFQNWRSQIASSNFSDKMGLRYVPFCFTEHGILMLSNVMKSGWAIQMSIRIIEVFVKMNTLLLNNKDILLKLEQIENKLNTQDNRSDKHEEEIKILFETVKQLIDPPSIPRKQIGYKRKDNE